MKTTYTPNFIARTSFYYSLLFLIIDSFSVFIKKSEKLKILVVPLLLLSQTARTQQLLTMGKVPSRRNLNASIIDNSSKEENNGEVTAILSNKADSAYTGQVIENKTTVFTTTSEDKANAMIASYFKGVDDADSNYRVKKSSKAAILLTTLIGGPVAGIIPTIACSAVKPNNKSLNIPSSALVSDDAYMKGYKNEAHFIKKHNTWPCYVLASIVWLAAANMILR